MREGRAANAVELAEFSIDGGVSKLWHQLGRIDDTQRTRAVEALHAVRGYRERWPREVKAEILAGDGLSTAQISKIADEAREILADLPKEAPGKDGGPPPSSARLVEGSGRGL